MSNPERESSELLSVNIATLSFILIAISLLASSGAQTILNCLVLGRPLDEIFTIEIARTANVSALKDLIKEKTRSEFDAINANRLGLWNVSCLTPCFRLNANDLMLWKIPKRISDDTLEHTLENFDFNRRASLPASELLTAIPHLFEEDYLHIVVEPGEWSVNIGTLSFRLITI
jgi:hypothetical protein